MNTTFHTEVLSPENQPGGRIFTAVSKMLCFGHFWLNVGLRRAEREADLCVHIPPWTIITISCIVQEMWAFLDFVKMHVFRMAPTVLYVGTKDWGSAGRQRREAERALKVDRIPVLYSHTLSRTFPLCLSRLRYYTQWVKETLGARGHGHHLELSITWTKEPVVEYNASKTDVAVRLLK